MRGKPDKYYDLAITDPPYGINVAKLAYTQEDNRPCKQKNGTTLRVKKLKYKHKDWDRETPKQEYFDTLIRVANQQIIFGVEYMNWTGLGTGRIKWIKGVPEGVSFKGYELAYCSLIDTEIELPLLWAGMQQAKSLSEPMIQQGNKKLNEKRIHPCHKPILLYIKLLQLFAKPGMKLIDTHGGGMSLAIACEMYGCDLDICEIDTEYFTAGRNRFSEYKSQLKLL